MTILTGAGLGYTSVIICQGEFTRFATYQSTVLGDVYSSASWTDHTDLIRIQGRARGTIAELARLSVEARELDEMIEAREVEASIESWERDLYQQLKLKLKYSD